METRTGPKRLLSSVRNGSSPGDRLTWMSGRLRRRVSGAGRRTFYPRVSRRDAHFGVWVGRECLDLPPLFSHRNGMGTSVTERAPRTTSPSSAMMRFTTSFESNGDLSESGEPALVGKHTQFPGEQTMGEHT